MFEPLSLTVSNDIEIILAWDYHLAIFSKFSAEFLSLLIDKKMVFIQYYENKFMDVDETSFFVHFTDLLSMLGDKNGFS